jgi:hypothetical protein
MARENAPPLEESNHLRPARERVAFILGDLLSHRITLVQATDLLESMLVLSEDRRRWGSVKSPR